MQELSSLSTGRESTITISYRCFYTATLTYLLLPVVVFLLGWLRLYIAIPAALAFLGLAFWSVKDSVLSSNNSRIKESGAKLSVLFVVVIAIVAVLLTVFSDIGEYVWGTTDHAFRRAIFRDLVDYKWPIIYDLSSQSNPIVNAYLPDSSVAFSYYFAFWMVPALVGKVFGFAAANVALVIWSSIGIFLTLLGMTMIIGKGAYSVIYAYIFFSGLDFIPYMYYQVHGTQSWMWLEGYTRHIVYISNINNIFNVFNQCIPCWLIVVLLMLVKNNRSVGFIGALTFAYSPWATIGMIPLAIYFLIQKKFMVGDTAKNAKNILHPLNIVPALLMIAIFAPMYMANSNATSVSGFTMNFYGGAGAFIIGYLFTLAIEIVPLVILLWKDYHKNILFWVTIVVLLVMPFYKISGQNDFTMRGSMPEFFVLTIMLAGVISRVIADSKNSSNTNKTNIGSLKMIGGFIVLLVMSMVAVQMLLVVFSSTFDGSERHNEDIYSLGDVKDESYLDLIDEQFYVYNYEDTFFFKYMARK